VFWLPSIHPDPTQMQRRARRLSTMVGALVLARATKGHALSNEIWLRRERIYWAVSIACDRR